MLHDYKRYVPTPLWIAARRANTYLERLRTWRAIFRQMEGMSAQDRSTLARSARAGWRSSLRQLDDWQDPQLLADARVMVHGIGEFNVRAHTDDLYHVLPARESSVVSAIKARLGPGDMFIDAGANIGFFTVMASKLVGPAGKVVAIEMIPDTALRLREHIALNMLSNVELVEQALADFGGQLVVATVPEGKFGQASIVQDSGRQNMRQVRVQTRTLDQILAPLSGRVSVMKMDLEGAEASALRGARDSLSHIDAVIFEQLGDETKVRTVLAEAGFNLSQLDGNNWLAERIQPAD